MDIYITHHALDRAKERLGINSRKGVTDEALAAMSYGKRKDNSFIYKGVVWGFSTNLGTLKTVYPVSGADAGNRA
jgi:hypothetical protein